MPSVKRSWDVSVASRARAASRKRSMAPTSKILGVRSRTANPFPTRFTERIAKRARTRSGMRTRSKSSTRTTMRRRIRRAGSAMGQPRRYMYKRSRLMNTRPNMSLLLNTHILRLQGVKKELQEPSTTGTYFPGYYVINTGVGSSVLSDTSVRPVYMVDLNSFTNTTTAYTNAVAQLGFDDGANPVWTVKTTQQQTGGDLADARWVPENTRFSAGDNNPQGLYVQDRWFDIRMKLYGARKQAVTYDVMLVKFDEEHFIPNIFTGTVAPTGNEANEYANFWQNISRNLSYNTILPGAGAWRRKVRVLRTRRVILNASTSDDLETNPDNVDLKWFVRDNKIRRFFSDRERFATQTAVELAAWNQVSQVTSVLNSPDNSRTRLFLLVRATDISPTVQGVDEDLDDSPSFDMCIRKKSILYPRSS